MSERRNISSVGYTNFYKIVSPVVAVIITTFIMVIGFRDVQGRYLIIFCLAMAAVAFRLAYQPKWVSIDEGFIYVSGIKKEIRVPWSSLAKVECERWQRSPIEITLWLKSPSEFGQKIIFFPKQRSFEPWMDVQPIVDELRAMMKSPKLR